MTPKNVCIPRELQLQAAMFRLGKVDDEIHAGYEILQKYRPDTKLVKITCL